MTALDVDLDHAILDALDFEPTRPCELTGHDARCAGDEPAAWRVFGWCPGCWRRMDMVICEPGRVRKATSDMGGCGACGHCHNWSTTYRITPLGGTA